MRSTPQLHSPGKRPDPSLILVGSLSLLLAIVSVAPVSAAAALAKIKLKEGTTVEGRIEGKVIQKQWSFPEGGGGYAIRDGSSITAIDENGIHPQKKHKVEIISTARIAFHNTDQRDDTPDTSALLGEIPKSALAGPLSSLEQQVIPSLRVRVRSADGAEVSKSIPVNDIVEFIRTSDNKQ